MRGSAPGAPLRAMVSVTTIWIVARVISWHGASHLPEELAIPDPSRNARQVEMQAKILPPAVVRKPVPGEGAKLRRPVPNIEFGVDTGVMPTLPNAGSSPTHSQRWPYSPGFQTFFLPAALRRSGAGSNPATKTIPRFPDPPPSSHFKRLAGYFWIHARQTSGAKQGAPREPGGAAANGRYGGSQAGAIFSYHLFDQPGPDLALYGRLSAALAPVREGEIALGGRIRPLRGLPLAVHAEQRFGADAGGAAGTAFFVTAGTGPNPIVDRLALETYGQAGYVLGRNETYFFDGTATLEHPLAESDGRRVAVGAGLWTGGQRGIRRLDAGPRASLHVSTGTLSTRIAIEGRFRVAGNARPGSGAALTVSTSF